VKIIQKLSKTTFKRKTLKKHIYGENSKIKIG